MISGRIGMHTSPSYAEDIFVGSLNGVQFDGHPVSFVVEVAAKGVTVLCRKIAPRDPNPFLAPLSNRFDMGKDPIAYAKLRAQLIGELWPKVIEDVTKDGDGYQQARRAFGIMLGQHGTAMYFASRYVGGLESSRSHKGDKDAEKPLVVIPADRQRDALALMEEQVFSDEPFNFPPELYNQLAASHWDHWGTQVVERSDYPAHEVILLWQDRIMSRLMSPLTLARMHDNELKVKVE